MENKKKRRDRKNCKFYRPRGRVTAYCDYLGDGLQCYKVCNFFVDSSTEELRQPAVIKSLPDFELQFCENCFRMTNHLDGICQKCKGNVL